MEDRIVEIIIQLTGNSIVRENKEIDLMGEGILDSLAFIELISSLEDEFDIEIQPTQIPGDTWKSIGKIAEMVENLQNK